MDLSLEEFNQLKDSAKLVLITPHGRSGSMFIHGILDGHPDMISVPYFINHYNIDLKNKDLSEIIDFYFELNKDIMNAGVYLGLKVNNKEVFDIDFIKKSMYEILLKSKNINNKEILVALFYAYSKFINKCVRRVKYIVVHLHLYDASYYTFSFDHKTNIQHHENILKDFSSKLYIALVSCPTLSILSYLRNALNTKNLTYNINYLIFCFLCLKKIKSMFLKETIIIDIDNLNQCKGSILFEELYRFNVEDNLSFRNLSYGGQLRDSTEIIYNTVSRENKIRNILSLKRFSKQYQFIAISNNIFKNIINNNLIKLDFNRPLFKFYFYVEYVTEMSKYLLNIIFFEKNKTLNIKILWKRMKNYSRFMTKNFTQLLELSI